MNYGYLTMIVNLFMLRLSHSLLRSSQTALYQIRPYVASPWVCRERSTHSEADGEPPRVYHPGSEKRPKQKEALKLKVRQHVNPLSEAYQKPIALETDWLKGAFENGNQKVVVDVGCAKGSWILQNAEKNTDTNYLGLEIRRPVVEYALDRKSRWGLKNVHFLATNANIDLPLILKDIVANCIPIEMITIHHPDPHFKKRHKKRRVVTPELVEEVAGIVQSGCRIFLQSDIEDVCVDMTESFLENKHFKTADGYSSDRLEENGSPHAVMTEREVATLNKGLPVFRMMVHRA